MTLKISLAQMAFQYGQPEANFERAAEWIAKAASRGSNLVLLPELWASGYDLENWRRYASSLDEGIYAKLSELAKRHKIAIGSSLLEAHGEKAYNTFALYGPDGSMWGLYRKIHLFRLLDEEKWLAAGDKLALLELPWGVTGLSTCYDLRFPEMYRPYAMEGAKLVLVVAEWPERRVEHWSKLLQARAIENQLFIAAVNKSGESQGAILGGHSAVIDPWGVPIVEGGIEEALLSAELDLREVENARRHIPVFKDRRPDVYGADRISVFNEE